MKYKVVKDVNVFLTRTHIKKVGGKEFITEDSGQERERVVQVSDKHTTVRVGALRTYNLGNYESLRVEVTIEVPCDQTDVPAVLKELATKLPNRIEKIKNEFVKEED